MISGCMFLRRSQVCHAAFGGSASDLQADNPVLIGPLPDENRPRGGLTCKRDSGQHTVRSGAGKGGTAGERSDPGITRCHARALGRQVTVRSARPNNDPVQIVAALLRQTENPSKRGPSLKTNSVATGNSIQSFLDVVPSLAEIALPRRWC